MVVPEKQIELQYDPTILFMNIYPKELKVYPKEIYPHGSITHNTGTGKVTQV